MDRWELSDPDRQTERSNGAFGKSDIEGQTREGSGERARDANELSKCGGRDEMDGQPEGRECGIQSSQWSPRKRCDIDNAKRWAQPESREDRVNHFVPRT